MERSGDVLTGRCVFFDMTHATELRFTLAPVIGVRGRN